MFQELFFAIAKLLDKPGKLSDKQKEVDSLYSLLGADKHFFRSAGKDEIFGRVASWAAESSGCLPEDVPLAEMSMRFEALAAIMYADFAVSDVSDELRADIACRSLWLYERADAISDNYSFDRQVQINLLREIVNH